jgi:hypothetical protein
MAFQRHYVIYVPGIKDDAFYIQSLLIQCWRLWGIRPVMFTMPWLGEEEFEPKLSRLISKIDDYIHRGYRVSLVGASAGASAVLNAYAKEKGKIQSVAYICGKVNHLDSVSRRTYIRNPAFRTSMQQLQSTISHFDGRDKRALSSFYSPADETVPHADTIIEGIMEQKLPSLGHSFAILYCLSIGSRKLIYTLKKLGI